MLNRLSKIFSYQNEETEKSSKRNIKKTIPDEGGIVENESIF